MELYKVNSGAYIDFSKVSAIYSKYVNGANDLSIFVVVDGVDVLINKIAVSFSDGGIEGAMAKRDAYIKHIADACAINIHEI